MSAQQSNEPHMCMLRLFSDSYSTSKKEACNVSASIVLPIVVVVVVAVVLAVVQVFVVVLVVVVAVAVVAVPQTAVCLGFS